jgi:hypothetical protein
VSEHPSDSFFVPPRRKLTLGHGQSMPTEPEAGGEGGIRTR